jgi:hypothetical protein
MQIIYLAKRWYILWIAFVMLIFIWLPGCAPINPSLLSSQLEEPLTTKTSTHSFSTLYTSTKDDYKDRVVKPSITYIIQKSNSDSIQIARTAPSTIQPSGNDSPLKPTVSPSHFSISPFEKVEDAIHAVQSMYPDVAGINEQPDNVFGKTNDISVIPIEDGWRLIFWKGWGDCPAGCINSRYWYFEAGTDGKIKLIGMFERLYVPALNQYKEAGKPLWGIPR